MKTCRRCNIEKEFSEFYFRKISKDGYRNECKECSYNPPRSIKTSLTMEEKKARLSEYKRIYNNKKKNIDYQKAYQKEYRRLNKDRRNQYYKNRLLNDNLFKLSSNIRNLIGQYLRNDGYKKKSKTQDILGCKFDDLRIYLESKFEPWMTWDNYGKYNGDVKFGWDIDHIVPISSAMSEDDLYILNHYTNLQPLCSYENRVIKRDKIKCQQHLV